MKKLLDLISDEMMQAFEQAGYDRALGKVTLSNRRTCANISVMARWLAQNSTKRHRL